MDAGLTSQSNRGTVILTFKCMESSQTHRHGGGRSHRGNRRSGARAQSAPSAEPPKRGESSRHKRASGYGGGRGKAASALCVAGALTGFCIELVIEMISVSREEPANLFFNGVAGLFVAAAFVLGVYAQMAQSRSWSRRVRRRLMIGLSMNVLTLVMVAANFAEKRTVNADQVRAVAAEIQAAGAPLPEDTALVQPGWYGELQADGVVVSVSSFPERSSTSRAFNRRVIRPVSYGTLTVVNLGRPEPVVIDTLQVGLVLDSGEEAESFAVKPLLRQVSQNHGLLLRLAEPQELAPGGMLRDIPVCREPEFAWERVRGVNLKISGRNVTVPGRMMTAEERQEALAKAVTPLPPAAPPAAPVTNLSAEAWFKDL